MTICRLLPLLTMAVIGAGELRAQDVLPSGEAAPNGSPGRALRSFPVNGAAPIDGVMTTPGQGALPVNSAAPIAGVMMAPSPQAGGSQDACMKEFMPLREEAEKRGKLIKAASDRHATPDEACKLIGSFSQAEIKLIKFIESYATKCGIPMQVADQLNNGHKNTETMQKKVCTVAQQGPPAAPGEVPKRRPAGPMGDFPPWYF